MTTDDREILTDVRHRLHGIGMALGQLHDQGMYKELEAKIDYVIKEVTRKLKR